MDEFEGMFLELCSTLHLATAAMAFWREITDLSRRLGGQFAGWTAFASRKPTSAFATT
jgi:hypothetical protein